MMVWTTLKNLMAIFYGHERGYSCRVNVKLPVTVAERSKASTVFGRSEVGILDSNPTQGMDVWCVCVYSVFPLSSV
jgi:hypothetical protein